jgi:hypothetical protein
VFVDVDHSHPPGPPTHEMTIGVRSPGWRNVSPRDRHHSCNKFMSVELYADATRPTTGNCVACRKLSQCDAFNLRPLLRFQP